MSKFKEAMLANAKAVIDTEADEVEVTYEEGYHYSEYTEADARFDVQFLHEGRVVLAYDAEDSAALFQALLKWEDETDG